MTIKDLSTLMLVKHELNEVSNIKTKGLFTRLNINKKRCLQEISHVLKEKKRD